MPKDYPNEVVTLHNIWHLEKWIFDIKLLYKSKGQFLLKIFIFVPVCGKITFFVNQNLFWLMERLKQNIIKQMLCLSLKNTN